MSSSCSNTRSPGPKLRASPAGQSGTNAQQAPVSVRSVRSAGTLNIHLSDVILSEELRQQVAGVNSGEWILFNDELKILGRYDLRENAFVVLHGVRSVTLSLSCDHTAVTNMVARPPMLTKEFKQLNDAGVLSIRAVYAALLNNTDISIDEVFVAPPEAIEHEPDEANGPQARNCPDLLRPVNAERDFFWRTATTQAISPALASATDGRATFAVNLPIGAVLALPALIDRTVDCDCRTQLINSVRSDPHIFGWFSPDERSVSVFEGNDLNAIMLTLDRNCKVVESITVSEPARFNIGRMEALGILLDGVRDQLIFP